MSNIMSRITRTLRVYGRQSRVPAHAGTHWGAHLHAGRFGSPEVCHEAACDRLRTPLG